MFLILYNWIGCAYLSTVFVLKQEIIVILPLLQAGSIENLWKFYKSDKRDKRIPCSLKNGGMLHAKAPAGVVDVADQCATDYAIPNSWSNRENS
jgi:hypothetical protein